MFRQGDVLIERVRSIPKGGKAVPRDRGRIVLAYSEVTGHAHAITDEEVTMIEVDKGIRYLDVQMEAFLRHEEHGTIALAPGKYTQEAARVCSRSFRTLLGKPIGVRRVWRHL